MKNDYDIYTLKAVGEKVNKMTTYDSFGLGGKWVKENILSLLDEMVKEARDE